MLRYVAALLLALLVIAPSQATEFAFVSSDDVVGDTAAVAPVEFRDGVEDVAIEPVLPPSLAPGVLENAEPPSTATDVAPTGDAVADDAVLPVPSVQISESLEAPSSAEGAGADSVSAAVSSGPVDVHLADDSVHVLVDTTPVEDVVSATAMDIADGQVYAMGEDLNQWVIDTLLWLMEWVSALFCDDASLKNCWSAEEILELAMEAPCRVLGMIAPRVESLVAELGADVGGLVDAAPLFDLCATAGDGVRNAAPGGISGTIRVMDGKGVEVDGVPEPVLVEDVVSMPDAAAPASVPAHPSVEPAEGVVGGPAAEVLPPQASATPVWVLSGGFGSAALVALALRRLW